MKTLPKFYNERPTDGLLYLGCVNPETEEIDFFGPVEGLQITWGFLRDPADGEHVGLIDSEGWIWMYAAGRNLPYSDVFVSFPEGA